MHRSPFFRRAGLAVALAFACGADAAQALSLREAEQELAARNRDIGLAAIEARGAAGDVQTAARRPAPELSLESAKISTRTGIGAGRFSDKRIDSTLGVSYLLERGGKRRWRGEEARGLARAAQHELSDTQRVQGLALHAAYYELKRAQETLQLARENQALAERALRGADLQVQAGDLAPVARARLAVDALKVADETRAAEREYLEAQQALALLLGRAPEAADLAADDDWPAESASETAAAVSLDRRADLLAAAARVDAAEAQRRGAQSLRKRDITVGFGVERDPTDQAGVTWGVSISVPLSGPGYHRGEIVRAEADYDSAVLSREKLRAEAETERAHARSVLASARQRLDHYRSELVPAAQQAIDGMEFAYAHGAADLTDLLDARRSWREAQQDLIAARSEYAIALAEWQAATQIETQEGKPQR